MKISKIKNVSVIGTGTIGAGWTATFLANGYNVKAWDPEAKFQSRLSEFIKTAWPILEDLDLVSNKASPNSLEFCNSAESAAEGADFIQESAPENINIKKNLYRKIEPIMKNTAILSSSTSGLLISDLQKERILPHRFVLGHPFNPPHLIPLVEVIGGKNTDPKIIEQTLSFYNSIGKKAIKINKEFPGHIANRLQAALWREAIFLAIEGVASLEDIDASISYGPGIRWAVMGPHLTFHLAGGDGGMKSFIQKFGSSISNWWKALGKPKLDSDTQKTLIEGMSEHLGKKSLSELTFQRDKKLLALLKVIHKF